MSLFDTGSSKEGSGFSVQSTTFNGRQDLVFDEHPVGASFSVDSKNFNGASRLALHPAFEGSFKLRSINSQPVVIQHDAKDPSGEKRQRHVDFRTVSNQVEGEVWWDSSEGKPESWATVQNTNGKVTLEL